MRKHRPLYYSLLVSGLIAAAAVVPQLFLTGCQAPSAQRQAFNTVWTLASTVNESWKAYCDLVIAGQLPTNNVPKVAETYNNFQLALKAASVGVMLNTNAPPSPELTRAADVFLNAVKAANQ